VSNVEDTNNSSDLSEFFSALSKEKKETRQKLKEEIANPESGLSNLFQQLEEVHRETQKVSEETSDNKSLSPDDQNKLEAFSSLMSSVDVSLQETQKEAPEVIETVEPVVAEVFNNNSEREDDKLAAFSKLFDGLAKVEEKQEPQKELVIEDEVSDAVGVLSGSLNIIPENNTKPQVVAQETNDIITSVINNLSDMEKKTEVKEEVDQITAIKTEFEKFKTHIQQHISNQGFSGGGSGETRVEFLDDVDRDTAKVDGKALIYQASSGKWIGGDASGGSSAADDLTVGDAAVTLTTSSGNITIDAAANNSDIIFKGTDGGADTTFLTIDGSDAGTLIANHDLELGTDGSIIKFGADNEIALTHVHNTGLLLTDSGGSPTLQFHDANESVSSDGSKLILTSGGTAFSLPTSDGSNGQALVTNGSGVFSFADASGGSSAADDLTVGDAAVTLTTSSGNITIDAAANDTDIIFKGTDGGVDITMLTLDGSADGAAIFKSTVTATGIIIGSTAVTSTATELNFLDGSTANSVVNSKAVVYGSSGELAGTLSTAAQTNITSLGTLSALQIDNININLNTISSTAGTDLLITPVAGQQIVLDGTIVIDAGVVTGATSITSTSFVGDITGDVTGNADTATTLATARTIGGTSFDGSANIAVALADTATALATARTIGGTSFDGTANIAVALATLATTVTITDNESTNENNALIFTAGGDVDGGNLGLESDGTLTYNPSTGIVTATGFAGALTGNVTGNASGTAATVTGAAQTAITSVGTLTALQVDNLNINGNTISSTAGTDLLITPLSGQQIVLDGAIVIDAGVVTGGTSITSTAFVGAVTGNADTATTLATARTIGGTSFNGSANIAVALADTATALATARTIGGTSFDGTANIAVALATLATTATVTDSTANTNFPVVFNDESNALLDDTGALRYNPSTGTLLVPNLVVAGTTSTVDTVTMEASNAIIFEGATADIHETTLTIVDPTADRIINLPNQSGTVPVLAAASNTAITSTPEELNILDGVTSTAAELNLLDTASANSVVNSKAVIYGSSGEVAGTLSTAAQANITSLGTLTALQVDNININLNTISSTAGTDLLITPLAGQQIVLDGTIVIDAGVVTGATSITSTAFAGALTGNVTGNASGTAATVTGAAQTAITSVGTLTALTVDNVVINGATIGHTDDTDLMTVANGIVTVAGEVSMTTLDIGGTNVTSTAAELNALDGITAVVGELNALDIGSTAVGTAVASKAVILDSSKDYTGIRNLTISGEIDAATGDYSGAVDIAGATTTAAITASGIIKTDDSTAATSTTDGSLQTDGGLSVVLDAVIGDDLIMLSDAAQIAFGTNSEITLAHVHNVGLTLTHVTAGDNLPVVFQLKSEEDEILVNEVLGSIEFAAGDSDGTDGATVAAGIHAIAEGTFSATANATKLVFTTGVSETAAASATAKATLSSIGDFQVAGDLVIKDGGLIGSASDLDAISISSGGVVNFSARPTFAASLTIQDGGSLGSASDINAITISSGGVVAVTATTASTSATSGALTVGGGAGIAADLSVGDDLFMISDAAVLTFGADKDVTLTHVADTGLLLNAAMVVQFRDSAINIGSPADGDLDINADDEIELNSTLIDINGNVEISGTALMTGVTTHGGNVVSDTDSTDDLGTTGVRWANLFVDAITATDQITATGFTGTLDGILGSGTAAAATTTTLASTTITASGIIKTDDTTAATSTTDGSLQTDGGLSVVLDAVIGDDIIMLSDAAVIHFGADSDITLTHNADAGLTLNGVMVATAFTAGNAVLAEAELELLDGLTAGTAIASKVVTTDSNKDTTGQRNLTISGELDAATLDISGAIDVAGNSVLASVDVTGVATAATFEPDGDTTAGDNAAIGYTAAEGLILTGQGSTNDVTIKNDADADVIEIPTGTTNVTVAGNLSVGATVNSGSGVIENSATIAANITITSGSNAMSTGPITVDTGVTVTVSSGSRWVVL
jgi:hypothetical protein